jgi:ABC-type glycerol-3-phosphate transport system permease component
VSDGRAKLQMKTNMKKSFNTFIRNGGVLLITILWVMPILWMLISTFRDPGQPYYFGLLPSRPTLVNYQKVLSEPINVWSLRNSAIVASTTAVFVLLIALPAAYGFSRFNFTGKRWLQILLLVIRLFPGIILAITLFQLAGFLQVYDSFIPLILANGLLNLPFAVWNLRTMFENLPIEVEEAAWLDGASRIGGIIRILMPLMTPGVAATGAFAFLLTWNEYLFAVSFIRSPSRQLITTTIAGNIGQFNIDFIGLTTTGMVASLPLLVIFLFIQRYIVSGIGLGAVRG